MRSTLRNHCAPPRAYTEFYPASAARHERCMMQAPHVDFRRLASHSMCQRTHERSRMNAPSPLPSLFGRFTAIFQDHDHLGKTLRRLREMCSALESGQALLPPELAPDVLIAELRMDLETHFGAEESAEYFGVVVEEEPNLTAQ